MIFKKECDETDSDYLEIDQIQYRKGSKYNISIFEVGGTLEGSTVAYTEQSMIELRDALLKEFPVGYQGESIDISKFSVGDFDEHPFMMQEAYRLDLLHMSHKFQDPADLQGWYPDPSYGEDSKKTSFIKKLFKKWLS